MKVLPKLWILCQTLLFLGCGNLEDFPTKEAVYKATFGSEPPPTIQVLQAYGRAFGDNSTCYLSLEISQVQLDRLIGNGFTQMTDSEFRSRISGGGISGPTPTWWKPFSSAPTVFLESNTFHPGFSEGRALVSYDPKSQAAYLYWSGID